MGILATALTNLAAVPVTGVTSFPPDETPDALTGAQLPALLILPELGGTWPGLEPSRFSAADGTLTVRVAHMLLLAPVTGGTGLGSALPVLADAIDTYAAALAGEPTLDGALAVALRCTVQAGVVRYAGIDYHGATFFHDWQLAISP
ncbi:MAG: hypothetical protein GYB65_14965 [Chloroflexi bacterium]|nr:hypothetical protein [Chloroflexota bacterium]